MGMMKKTPFGRRTWSLVRLVMLWARKGGVCKRGLMMDLRLLSNHLKTLGKPAPDSTHYMERQFSFEDTPIFHFKTHRCASSMRFHIPCPNTPPVDFDFNDDIFYNYQHDIGRKGVLSSSSNERGGEEEDLDDCDSEDDERRSFAVVSCREEPQEDDGSLSLRWTG